MNYESVVKYMNGLIKQPRGNTLRMLADALDTTERALLFGETPWPTRAPVIGEAAGGERWIPAEGAADTPEMIEIEIADDDPVAVRVRGTSMSPVFRDGDILIAYRGRGLNVRDAIGLDCIVETVGGERYVKILQRGAGPGRFRLRSYHPDYPDIDDIAIAWVAPVALIKRTDHRGKS